MPGFGPGARIRPRCRLRRLEERLFLAARQAGFARMDRAIAAAKLPGMKDPSAVREMFSSISPRYDLLNRLLSCGQDRRWRRKAAELLDPAPGALVLDLCGGTGDLALESARRGARVICCDFSGPMLLRAERKFDAAGAARPASLLGDALRVPLPDGAADGITIGFGLRNLRTIEEGLAEMRRLLRAGGTLCVLEFSRPQGGPMAALYGFYLNRLLPRIGDGVSRHAGPYGYLARTIGEFPPADELAAAMTRAGFREVRWVPLSGGIVAVHLGRR